jgi:hypothetical protein
MFNVNVSPGATEAMVAIPDPASKPLGIAESGAKMMLLGRTIVTLAPLGAVRLELDTETWSVAAPPIGI